ncbi:hypothetical protein BD311DRAFT_524692 [Dichomitus squalens]|uniref:Uncharacterized protein n=1 Tax=Dichomitus squalens TaxID=114155 RepID=A0A4Q9MGT8_9APHY|nr:hypothetical protein BD311DRAFT_524692 [Dichomitus squalens]
MYVKQSSRPPNYPISSVLVISGTLSHSYMFLASTPTILAEPPHRLIATGTSLNETICVCLTRKPGSSSRKIL